MRLPAASGDERLLGARGTVAAPRGQRAIIRVGGDLWAGRSAGGELLREGQAVEVVGREGTCLLVEVES